MSNTLCAFDFSRLVIFTVVLSAPYHQPSFPVRAWDRHRYNLLSTAERFQREILLGYSFFKIVDKIFFLFLDDAKISSEVDNGEGFDREVGEEDEIGTNEHSPNASVNNNYCLPV